MNSKHFIFFLLFLTSLRLFADAPHLKSVTMTMDPMTTSMQRLDANGNICSLVKVILPNPGVSFEGNVVGDIDYKISEYWCYLSPNTKFLKIKYPGLEPLMIDFSEFFSNGIQSKKIYEVNILIPHRVQSTGSPIRLTLSTQGDYYNAWNYNECRIRSALVAKLDYVDVYLNMKNSQYDNHVRVENSNFKDCLLADVHVGDIITVIPNKDSYAKRNLTVIDSVISGKLLSYTIPRQRMNNIGMFIDAKTEKPICNVNVKFYNLNQPGYNSEKYLFGSSKTNDTGKYLIKNCFSKYIYNVKASCEGYKIESFDVIADTTVLVHKLSPKEFHVQIFDGKKPIEGVKLSCDNLYDNTFYTDTSGRVTVVGALNKVFTINHPDYETMVITRDLDTNITLKMKKGDASIVKEAYYDGHKDKLIFK